MSKIRKMLRGREKAMHDFKALSQKQQLEKFRANAERFGFVLHCDGIKRKAIENSHGDFIRDCKAKLIVPMVSIRSIEELNMQVRQVDWRVSVGKTENKNESGEISEGHSIAFVQCTDCWIDHFRIMITEAEDCGHKTENIEDLLTSLDTEKKFWNRLQEKFDFSDKNKNHDTVFNVNVEVKSETEEKVNETAEKQ